MSIPTRVSVKVILLNEHGELLLLRTEDPNIGDAQGKGSGVFWQMVGGAIEEGETLQQAALREVFEETGIRLQEEDLGPVVWQGELYLTFKGVLTHIKQSFVVAKTRQRELSLANLTEEEKGTISALVWFSLTRIAACRDPIYPAVLVRYLPDIIAGKYPSSPLHLSL